MRLVSLSRPQDLTAGVLLGRHSPAALAVRVWGPLLALRCTLLLFQHPHGTGPCVRLQKAVAKRGARARVWDSPSGPGAHRTCLPHRGHPCAWPPSGFRTAGPTLTASLPCPCPVARSPQCPLDGDSCAWVGHSVNGSAQLRPPRGRCALAVLRLLCPRASLCPRWPPAPLGWIPLSRVPAEHPHGGHSVVSRRVVTCPARHCTPGQPHPGSTFCAG